MHQWISLWSNPSKSGDSFVLFPNFFTSYYSERDYQIAIRGRKWWWPLFTNCLNIVSVNAWKIQCLIAKKNKFKSLRQIGFKSELTRALLTFVEKQPAEVKDVELDSDDEERPRKLVRINIRKHVICEDPKKRRLGCAHCYSHEVFRYSSWLKIVKSCLFLLVLLRFTKFDCFICFLIISNAMKYKDKINFYYCYIRPKQFYLSNSGNGLVKLKERGFQVILLQPL